MILSSGRTGLVLVLLLVTTAVAAEPLPRFQETAVWNQEISSAALHPDSAPMVATLESVIFEDGFESGDVSRWSR